MDQPQSQDLFRLLIDCAESLVNDSTSFPEDVTAFQSLMKKWVPLDQASMIIKKVLTDNNHQSSSQASQKIYQTGMDHQHSENDFGKKLVLKVLKTIFTTQEIIRNFLANLAFMIL